MSDPAAGNPTRIWVRKQLASIIQVNGRNHAQIQGESSAFPLFDYSWRATVFNYNGEWVRLVDVNNPADAPKSPKQPGNGQSPVVELQFIAKAKEELVELEKRVKAGEKALAEQRKQFEAEMAQERAKIASEWNRLQAQQASSGQGPPRTLPVSPSHQPIAFGYAPSGLAPEVRGSTRVLSLPPMSPSPSGASLSSTNTTSTTYSIDSIPQTPDRIMAKHTSSISNDSFLNPLSASSLSSSLPNRSGWGGNVRPSPPSSGKLGVRPAPVPTETDESSHKTFLSQGLRRVTSLPQSLPTEPYQQILVEASSDPVLGGTTTPRGVPSVESTPRAHISADLSEDQKWTKEQCEEWLKGKLYPSTDPNDKSSSGQRAIHCASLDGHLQVVEFLVSRGGVDVSQKDLLGNTPLICAASKGRLETVKWLLANGAVLNGKAPSGRSALHSAAAGGYLQVCQFLVEKGANAGEKEQFGKTPRNLAESYQHKAVAEYLKTIESTSS